MVIPEELDAMIESIGVAASISAVPNGQI